MSQPVIPTAAQLERATRRLRLMVEQIVDEVPLHHIQFHAVCYSLLENPISSEKDFAEKSMALANAVSLLLPKEAPWMVQVISASREPYSL